MYGSPASQSYLDYLSSSAKEADPLLHQRSEAMLAKAFGGINPEASYAPVVFLSDFVEKEYIYIHKGVVLITGYTAKYYVDGG